MFKFRRFTLFFFMLLLAMNLWNLFSGTYGGFFHNYAALLYWLLISIYFGISFAMAFVPCSGFHHTVICHGNSQGKSLSITFDDGPDPEKTPLILDNLKRYNVQATFFCIGKNLAGNEVLVKRIIEEGHLIGNHSYTHSKWFDLYPARKMRAEMLETDRLIHQITGKSPLYFRPPFGVVNPMVSNALKNMHWQAIGWNIRSLDTLQGDPEKIKDKILSQLKPGAIILLHDFTAFSEFHLDSLLSEIKKTGFEIIPLDELTGLPPYSP
ncbi:MAG: polysaccharide deacetylase family protein [Bacteroidales bacterium]